MKQILDFDKFNLYDYLFYEKVENGDLNWIIPGKLIAFCDPQTYSESSQNYIKLYINYFRKNNVTTIIRLNKSRYDATLFTSKSFVHHDLIFLDGSAPTDWIMKEFLRICESSPGAVAVHCKGLFRDLRVKCNIANNCADLRNSWIRSHRYTDCLLPDEALSFHRSRGHCLGSHLSPWFGSWLSTKVAAKVYV